VPERVVVIGVGPGGVPAAPVPTDAALVVGAPHHLSAVDTGAARRQTIGRFVEALDAIEAQPGTVAVLASGDPGFFGIVRALATRLTRLGSNLEVHPAPSFVSLAFGRVGLPWDDATVVSTLGRSLKEAVAVAARAAKAAVFSSRDAPPQAIGRALVAAGASHEHVAVCSRLGGCEETVTRTDLAGLASGNFDPRSVVVLWSGEGLSCEPTLAYGRPEARFAHRGGLITKSTTRAVVIAKLALPAPGATAPVLWDVGAGSGSVAIECALLAPWMDVLAVERDPAAAQTVRDNARAHGVAVRVFENEAPGGLSPLPDPDRVFVGGGGVPVVEAVLGRLRPGGVMVATFAALERAAAAAELLGNMTLVAASHGRRLDGGGWRLVPDNPVFVCWGPEPT